MHAAVDRGLKLTGCEIECASGEGVFLEDKNRPYSCGVAGTDVQGVLRNPLWFFPHVNVSRRHPINFIMSPDVRFPVQVLLILNTHLYFGNGCFY